MKAKKTIVRTYYKNHTQTFNASGSFQTFTVPATVTSLSVDCVASKGNNGDGSGGNGGRVQCVTQVTAGSTLYIMVGAIPSSQAAAEYNASDIRTNNAGITDNTSLNSRILVAGGGGSGSSSNSYNGGAGGGLTGGNGTAASSNRTGKGGTQTAGGAGGRNANSGSFGLGGAGDVGGAGGAGWYGGGAGSSASFYWGGGGGGSSYTDSSCSEVVHTQGYNNGAGYITISYTTIGTESDYDYYKDSIMVEVVKKNNKYYA